MSFDWDGRLVFYPEDRARRYLASGSWSAQPTGQRLHDIATRFPGRTAVVTAEGSLTYAELDSRTDRLAAGLLRIGLRPRDPVLFQLTNRLDTVAAWYATVKAGLVPVATLAAHRGHEIGQISRKVGAAAHLVDAGSTGFDLVAFAKEHAAGHPTMRAVIAVGETDSDVERFAELADGIDPGEARAIVMDVEAAIEPTDVVTFQLSGGTTGVPKVIPRIHGEYWNNALLYARHCGWDEQSRIAHMIPVVHNAGITCAVHGAHSVGACLVLATPDAPSAFELMAAERVTDVLVGHGHYRSLFSEAFEQVRPHLRRVVLSGAKVDTELFDHVQRDGAWAGQLFGMSEGMFIATPQGAPAAARRATVGVPIGADDDVRILTPGTEDEVPPGEVGELCCRGSYTIPGYFDAPDHNVAAFTSDGFYRTGDLAALVTIEGAQYVSIEGRIKDLINRGGEKVNAEELELLLLAHPVIANVAVVAMPDPRLGEKTCAYLVSATGETVPLSVIQDHLASLEVAKFKWPERLEWVDDLPRSNVGKVDKKALRADVAAKVSHEVAAVGADDRSGAQ